MSGVICGECHSALRHRSGTTSGEFEGGICGVVCRMSSLFDLFPKGKFDIVIVVAGITTNLSFVAFEESSVTSCPA